MNGLIETVLVGIPVIGVLIIIHELGHFLVAKWCGVGVVKFSIGFGPVLYSRRVGETDYQIGAIPLGGYVRMLGDMPDLITGEQESDAAIRELESQTETDRSRWFLEKGFFARSAIVVAGPLFNLISAVLFIVVAVLLYGQQVPKKTAEIGGVISGSPAEKAGLLVGDVVTSINGNSLSTWEEVAKRIHSGTGDPLTVEFDRAGSPRQSVIVQPQERSTRGEDGERVKRCLIGIEASFSREPASLITATGIGFKWVGLVARETCRGIWGMITGHVSTKELAGPILIFSAARSEAKKGFESVLRFMAVLSVSLAVLNLLPVPLLDGGHLLFFTIEAVLGPLSVRKKEFAQNIGLLLLLFLMVFALVNDFGRVIGGKSAANGWEEN